MAKHNTVETVKLSLIALLLTAVPALAERPTIQYTPFPSAGIVSATAALCGFDILAVPQAGRPNGAKLILFENGGILTGSLFLTLTNLSTGKTANVNIGGPAQLTFNSDGTTTLVGMGHGLVAFPPAPLSVTQAAGLPPVPLIYGRAEFTIDAQGNVLAIQNVRGTVQDACALLQ